MTLRIAAPYTGLILSTRESEQLRREMLELGISQISAGSCTGVGGYSSQSVERKSVSASGAIGANEVICASEAATSFPQFEVQDERSPLEVVKSLLRDGYIPSYCTACYKEGRTGDIFMKLAKSGNINKFCTPNALTTLNEFLDKYGDDEARALAVPLNTHQSVI